MICGEFIRFSRRVEKYEGFVLTFRNVCKNWAVSLKTSRSFLTALEAEIAAKELNMMSPVGVLVPRYPGVSNKQTVGTFVRFVLTFRRRAADSFLSF